MSRAGDDQSHRPIGFSLSGVLAGGLSLAVAQIEGEGGRMGL